MSSTPRTRQVARVLHEAAEKFEDYPHVLDKAHEQHHWSLGKILTAAAVVVVVVTIGAAAPAAAAADAAIVSAEVAATTATVGTASAAAVEAAEAVTVAVRALHALRAVATFLKPPIAVTAGLIATRSARSGPLATSTSPPSRPMRHWTWDWARVQVPFTRLPVGWPRGWSQP